MTDKHDEVTREVLGKLEFIMCSRDKMITVLLFSAI